MLYVRPLSEPERTTLQEMQRKHPLPWSRMRAQAILMSAEGYRVQAIATLHNVCRQTVSTWLKAWECDGLIGLVDQARRGRPRKLSAAEEAEVLSWLEEEPRSLKKLIAKIRARFGVEVSRSTVKRLCKRAARSWKRVRKSPDNRRDEDEVEKSRQRLEALREREAGGEIALYYFDESGFTLEPCIPYAWQPLGKTIRIPSSKSQRLNVLGFLNRACDFQSFVFEGSINASVVVACFEAFSKTLTQDTVIILDNASIHRSEEFEEHLERWKNRGLSVEFIAPYAPELNRIEILWRKIKYEWMPFAAYESFASLTEKLFEILANIGKDYTIEFS